MKSLGIEGWVLKFDNDQKYKNNKAKDDLKKKKLKTIDSFPIHCIFIHQKMFELMTTN